MGLSYQRFKAGSSAAFQQGFDEAAEAGGAPQGYTGGPEDMGGEYGQQPFQGGGGQSGKGFRNCTVLKSIHIIKYPSLLIAHSILGCLFNHNVYSSLQSTVTHHRLENLFIFQLNVYGNYIDWHIESTLCLEI